MLCYVLKSNKPGREVVGWRERESDKNEEYIHENPFYASASPLRSARSARTSVTYCNASRIGMRWSRPLSVGSLIQPSIGMALSS